MPSSSLAPGAVCLTLHSVEAITSGLFGQDQHWLSEQEQGRLSSITATRRRTEFLAGRWLARQCLAANAGGRWQDYVLSAPDGAAPTVLSAPKCGLEQAPYFSLSHSADWLACAVSNHPVGVDVEDVTRLRDIDALGDWIYGPQERAHVDVLPEPARREHFFALWTLKEAWIKQAKSGVQPASMRDVQFIPRAGPESQAVVLQGQGFTMAIVSPCSVVLSLDTPNLSGLPIEHWEVLSDQSD